MRNKNFKKEKGQAALITILIIASVLAILVAAFGALTVNDLKTIDKVTSSSQSYYVAESGIEDALVRIANKLPYSNNYTLAVGNGSTEVEVSGTVNALVVTSKGNVSNHFRKLSVNLDATTHSSQIAFNYGLQVNYGGLIMSNNSGVNGNVYSNGDILGSNGAFISGSAYAANSPALAADQVNDSPLPPGSSIVFGNATASQDLAQSFQVSVTEPISKIQLYLKKTGSPTNATVRIVNNNSGSPGTITIDSGTLASSTVGSSYSWIDVNMNSGAQLSSETTYWLVVDASTGSGTKNFTVGANNTYSLGQAKIGQFSGSWNNTSPSGLDAYFKVYLGGTTGVIDNVNIGTSGVGDAHAHVITDSTITGSVYCQSGSGNNKVCDTSQPDPTPQNLPISQANIDDWQAEAAAGGTLSGNYTLDNGAVGSLGPTVITGDLNLSNNVTFTMTGTIWVQGKINLENNVTMKLDPGYGSSGGILLASGYINLVNNAIFQGSGDPNSYFLLLTTNDCVGSGSPTGLTCTGSNSAMDVSNNVGSVILYSSRGQINLANNAEAKEVNGYKVFLSNNATINYQSGLANANFSSGPGGGYNISNWIEIS
ncbi:MAG: choice-of-anchor R domain-containing protein [bacterium]|nr:choice-of-anchor R domain-containing protein [bacterium]